MPPDDAPKQKRQRKPRPLNANQIAFVDRWLATLPRNATQAYIDVYGGTKNAANANASRLLQDDRVKALIAEREDAIAEPFRLSQSRIRKEMALLSYSDPTHYMQGPEGQLILAPGAPADAMRAVKQVEITKRTIPQAGDKPAIIEITTKFRLWDKPSMLRLSAQHKGMIKRSVEVGLPTGGGFIPESITVEIVDSHEGKPVKARAKSA